MDNLKEDFTQEVRDKVGEVNTLNTLFLMVSVSLFYIDTDLRNFNDKNEIKVKRS